MLEVDQMKVLNLYACLGGNRFKWDEVAKEANIDLQVKAVELDPELARMYQERFPNDTVIVGDAHQYLLDNYKEFDFIWSSPPCPTHSKARYWFSSSESTSLGGVYPDMTLYQEILFLQHYFKGKYVVENVVPYYEPLIPPKKRGRHLYWTNFLIPGLLSERADVARERGVNELTNLCDFHSIDLTGYQGEQNKVKIARNLVDYEAGRTILETALGIIKQQNIRQPELFS